MRADEFDRLTRSIKEAGQIRRGEQRASRTFDFGPEDIRAIRRKLDKTQIEFAMLIGVSPATLRNWEQGRRKPDGPARALLKVAAEHPEAVAQALSE